MEGMPRLPMLTPEFKFSTASLPAEFSTKIKEYILMHYQDDPSKYDAAINEMMSLRAQFGRLVPDVETVCQMKRYYAQLTMMKSRFPMEEGDPIKIPFSWLDKAMDMPSSAVYEDVNFELTSVMFNIGAIHAAIAANETRIDLDSIKNAFTHFQCAAFPFQHIRDRMNAAKYSSIDFEPSLLTWYVNILLAQAQECILEKSLIDHRKNTVIAKIAVYLRDIYMSCHEHLESSGLSDIISSSKYREWLRTCDVKAELYGVVAMVHLGEQADADKKMGDRLAYYQIASEHVKAAAKLVEKDKRESLRQAVVFATDVVVAKETNAKKENDFIYHERIPRREELTMVEGVSMVKPIGFEPTDRSIAGDDLFAALLPMNVLKSVSMYSEEKAKLKRAVFDRVEAKDRELDDYMLSLQLDEINLDKSVDELKLPEMLLERSATFNAQPDAFPDLLDKLQRVGHCAIEADHKLDDLHNRLSAIDSPDLTSDAGFEAIKKELERISDHHTKARTNNAQLQRAIAAHSENLRVLAMPLGELNRRISGPAVKPSETAEGAQLKRMLCKTEEMRKQRSQLLDTFSKDLENDDITAKCLAEKDLDNTDLYSRELKKHDEVIQLIDMNLAAQVKILAALTEANASFADCRRQVMELNRSRADQVLALTAAYDVYVDVLQKADEGLKFYSTLFSLTRTLDEAMEGIENAYEEEKAAKEKEKRQLEERARELRMAREAREAMEQFRNQPIDSPHSSALVSPLDFPPSAADGPKNVGGARLKDYMAYYRAKIAGHMPPSSQQHPTGIISSSSSAFSSCAQGLGLPGTLPPPQSPYVNATGIAPPAAALSMSMPQGYQSTAGNAVTASSRMAQNSPSIQPYVGVGSATVGPLGTPSTGRSVVAPAALQASLQHPLQMPSQPAVSNFLPTHTSHQPSIALFGSLSQPLTATSIVQPPSQPAVGVGYYVQSVGHNAHAFQHASNTAGSAKQLAQNEAQMPHAPAAVQNAVQMPQNSMQYAQHFAVSVCPSGTASQQQSQLSDLGSQTVQPQKTVATTQLVNGCISALPFAPNAISQHMQSNVAHNMQNSTAPITAQTPSTASCAMMNSGITLQNRTHPLSPVVGAVNASSGTQFTELPITSLPQTAISSATSITHSAHPSALSSEIPSNMQGGVIPDSFITTQMSDSSSAFAQ
ncbi:unnamed protein product, partial [Toxocara canis]|uniref:BRO1 domain-containing protein n=1 Tax=Toxocara canis TaxID=6265 RepID=A0A183UTX6_TOXCA